MRCCLLAGAFMLSAGVSAFGQECPKWVDRRPSVPSQVRTLEGQLVFHDGIRKWFELKFDEPQCGEESIQLLQADEGQNPLEVLRGCRVRSRGAIDFSPTGYYSRPLHQVAQLIESVGECARRAPFPDYSKVKPDKAIRAYRVDMQVNYEPGDHPIIFRVTSSAKELEPWQAYANYLLTGGGILYGHCADGFVVDEVFGTPEARPGHFDDPRTSRDMAMFDTEDAAGAGKTDLQVGYTCVRDPEGGRRKHGSRKPEGRSMKAEVWAEV